MNLDAFFSFTVSVLAAGVTLFTGIDPTVAAVLRELSTIAGLLGTAFHLDGK
jgi:hypothetical protein